MLHYILAQVSIHLISSMWKRIFHQHWVHVASSRFSTVLVFASLGFCPAFPRGGLFYPCVPSILINLSIYFHRQSFVTVVHVLYLPGASAWWQQPDFGETPRHSHTCGDGILSVSLFCTGPRPSHSQLHFDSFRSRGLETVEKLKRQTSFAIWVFISIISAISSSSTRASPRNSTSVEWSVSI